MMRLYGIVLATALMFSTGYAQDGISEREQRVLDFKPPVVTGLVTGPKIKNATIIGDKIAYEGDTFEVKDGKLLGKIVVSKKVKARYPLMKVVKITSKGVTITYEGETFTVVLKSRV